MSAAVAEAERDVVGAEEVDQAVPPRRRGRWVVAAVLGLIAVVVMGWWGLSTPRFGEAGMAGVLSDDHPVVKAPGAVADTWIVPHGGGTSTVVLGLVNAGRVPMMIDGVWPVDPMSSECAWTPTGARTEDLPSADQTPIPAGPAEGYVLEPGRLTSIRIEGTVPGGSTCEGSPDSIAFVDTVDVAVRVLGRPSTVEVPLGYRFAWSADPQGYAARWLTPQVR